MKRKMKRLIMINDLIDLIKLQSKNIEHYKQYPIALLFFIMLLLEVPSTFLSEKGDSSISYLLTYNLAITFVFTFIEAIFFVYWYGRIGKKYSFIIFLHYDAMLTIAASIPVIGILLVMQSFDSLPWVGIIGFLTATLYVLYMFIANLAKATSASKKYAFVAIFIVAMLQVIPEALLL